MSAYELTRYLDYCSEMLSLAGKVAALYAQNFPDAVVLAAVNEVETLTTGLSRKIWQKIMILNKLDADTPHSTNKPDAPVISPG
jgi:poly-beta-hydroxyalkanoate depolymerase